MFTYVYSCLPMCNCVYLCIPPFTHVYLCLVLFVCACLPMVTPVYQSLSMFTTVYSCFPMFNYVYSSFTHVYPYLLVFTYVYSCLPMFAIVYSCLFTIVYSWLFTYLYPRLPMFTGPSFGNFPEPQKCYLIVKGSMIESASSVFKGTGVNVVTSCHFVGGIIGDHSGKVLFVNEKVEKWSKVIQLLSSVAKQPQAAFIGFTKSLQPFCRELFHVVAPCSLV